MNGIATINTGIAGRGVNSLININYVISSYHDYRTYRTSLRRCYLRNPAVACTAPSHISNDGAVNNCSSDVIIDRRFIIHVPRGLSLTDTTPVLYTNVAACSPLGRCNIGTNSGIKVLNVNNLNRVNVGFTGTVNTRIALFAHSTDGTRRNHHRNTSRIVISASTRRVGTTTKRFSFLLSAVPIRRSLGPCLSALHFSNIRVLINLVRPISPPMRTNGLIVDHHMLTNSLVNNITRARRILSFYTRRTVAYSVRVLSVHRVGRTCTHVVTNSIGCHFIVSVTALGT